MIYICKMKSFESRTEKILDVAFCCIFMPLMILLGPAHDWLIEWPLFFMLDCVYLLGCYFAVRRENFPKLFIEHRYRRILAVCIVMILVNWALTFYPHPQMDFVIPSMSAFQTSMRNYNVSLSLWLMFFAVMCFALTISFITELYHQTILRKDIELQRDKAELAMFKAQISPHFLFNTLNSLYSLVIGTSQKAEDAFIMFTDLLKYTYLSTDKDTVTIGEEVEYITNYIELQRLRLNHHTQVIWKSEIDDPTQQIPPMIFLTFVENAFKYGASPSRDCTVTINLKLHHKQLIFTTHNRLMKHADAFRTDIPTGLNNCRARLDGLFPGKYTLKTTDENDEFILALTLRLN